MRTGDEYRASLLDGRRVYANGQRVDDVTTHPTTRVAVDWVARGYDAAVGDGANPLFEGARTVEELRARAGMVGEYDHLLNTTYQSLMTLRTVAERLATEEPNLAERMLHYIDEARANDVRIAECITDAKGDRSLPPAKQDDADSYVRIVARTPTTVTVRGAKLHITGASIANDLLIIPTKRMAASESEYAVAFVVPANAAGVHLVSTTYAPTVDDDRHFPISRRDNMPDCMVILDDVLVPIDRVFLDGQTHHSALFAHSLGLWERLGGTGFMADEADALVGLASLIAEVNGTKDIPHIKHKISEMVLYATLVRAGMEAAIFNSYRSEDGYLLPSELFTNAAKHYGAANYNLIVRHLHDVAGGSVVTAPTLGDLENPDCGHLVRKYMATGTLADGDFRTRIFHAIRDLTADSLGGWHLVTNQLSGGGLFAQEIVTRKHYDFDRARNLALGLLYDGDDDPQMNTNAENNCAAI